MTEPKKKKAQVAKVRVSQFGPYFSTKNGRPDPGPTSDSSALPPTPPVMSLYTEDLPHNLETYKSIFSEFTLNDFNNYISKKTTKFRKERNAIKGPEVRRAILGDFDVNTNTATFLLEPTHSFASPGYPHGAKRPRRETAYEVEVQLVDLDKWYTGDWKDMPLSELRQILDVADLKLHCSCSAFLWQGHRYVLTTINSALYPLHISDPVWGPRHDFHNGLCKHLVGVVRMLKFSAPWLLREIKRKVSG